MLVPDDLSPPRYQGKISMLCTRMIDSDYDFECLEKKSKVLVSDFLHFEKYGYRLMDILVRVMGF